MAKITKSRRRLVSRQCRITPYLLPSFKNNVVEKEVEQRSSSKPMEKNEWEDATCSVCLEFPHSAVLLLCSSYDKGCRPYMCGTSYRHSNCLNEFMKAYTKVMPPENLLDTDDVWRNYKHQAAEFACPLCRGQVKGWTVVKDARKFLNKKKRTCMQDDCFFVGAYKELRKHVRAVHPFAKPRKVDPMLEQKWRNLEHERERADVISTLSSIPGAMVLGDYVIEGGRHGFHLEGDGENNSVNHGFHIGNSDNSLVSFLLYLQTRAGDAIMRSHLRWSEREGVGYRDVPQNAAAIAAFAETLEREDVHLANQGRVAGLGSSERQRRRRSQQQSVIDVT